MCAISTIIATALTTALAVGTSIYSASQQRKAQNEQNRAIQQLSQTKTKVADTNSKTASSAKVNETPKQQRGISSLRIPTNQANTVNMSDTNTGLNIPM